MDGFVVPCVRGYLYFAQVQDIAGVLACFAPAAIVTNGKRAYRGRRQIRRWHRLLWRRGYAFTDWVAVDVVGAQWTVTVTTCCTRCRGPGLRAYQFTVDGQRILALTVLPADRRPSKSCPPRCRGRCLRPRR